MLQPAYAERPVPVAMKVRLRDLNVDAARQDERRIEVIANGLALWGGAQVAVDTTLVRRARPGAGSRTAGAALLLARKAKERTYPELRHSARCKLVVLALELGGRWSHEAANLVRRLARLRARAARHPGPAVVPFVCRWSSHLSFAAARAFAASLLLCHSRPLPMWTAILLF